MGDDITIGVTEIVNNIEVTAQPNDQIVDISVIDNTDEVTLNITPTVIEINVNKGSSYAKWGTILGTLSDQEDLQDALDLKADLVDGKVPSSQLPSYVDDVIEVANYAALPATGETGKIYVTVDNNKIFRWTGSTYVEIIDSAAVWGAITGTLSSQTDLQNALNLKANDNAVVKLTGNQSIDGNKTFITEVKTVFQNGDATQITFKNTGDLTKTLNIGYGSNGNIISSTGLDFRVGGLTSSALLIASNENATFKENLTAKSFIKSGGTSSQFLKADGSIDSTTYQTALTNPVTGTGTTNYLPKFTGSSAIGNSLIFDNGTNVGIGTASPLTALTVSGNLSLFTTNQIRLYNSAKNNWAEMSSPLLGGDTEIDFKLVTKSGVVYVNPTGSVGIGTTSPIDKLSVLGAIRLTRTDDSAQYCTIQSDSNGSFRAFAYRPYAGAGNYGDFRFVGGDSTGATATLMYINTNGNVGIGTTSPATLLTISSLAPTFTINRQPTGTQPKISLTDNGSEFSYIQSSAASSTMRYDIGPSAGWGGIHAFYTDTTEKMRITSGGSVGIGTTSPSEKLEVQNGASGAKIKVSNSGGGYAMLECSSNATSTATLSFTNSLNLSGGSVGIGTTSPSYQLQLSTDSAAKPTSALWTIASDERIKENINSYTKGLNELLKINPITYDYNGLGGFKKGKGGVGIIAQEIAEILPDSVSSIKRKLNETDEEEIDILNFNGHELTYILINAVKELKAEIEILKNK